MLRNGKAKLRALLALSIFITTTMSHFETRADATRSQLTTPAQLENLFKKLDIPGEKIMAAKELAKYRYSQVSSYLALAVKREVHSQSPDGSFVITALNSVISLAAQSELLLFENIYSEFKKVKAQFPMSKKIDELFTQLVAAAKEGPQTLPSLHKPPAIVTAESSNMSNDKIVYLREVVKNIDPKELEPLKKNLFLAAEEVIYSNVVNRLKAGGPSTKFDGREDELNKMAQAALRGEKSHILLTGKAGVGKTTLVSMLQEGWIDGRLPYPGQNPPIIIELPITDVIANPLTGVVLKQRIKFAIAAAQETKRHIFLYVDEAHVASPMTKNAIKSFLAKEVDVKEGVHLIWSTTSDEARAFTNDSAFSRRWIEVNVREFNMAETIAAIKNRYLEKWRARHQQKHVRFQNITDDAYELAVKYGRIEQPHAGNPVGAKELLEGAIIYKVTKENEKIVSRTSHPNEKKQPVQINADDLRAYMKFQLGLKLIPGDKNFDKVFEEIWSRVELDYVGNDALKLANKTMLKSFFGTFTPSKMHARLLLGPPGAGKSFFPAVVSKHFFGGEPLILNGAELTNGHMSLTKLIGSTSGYVGSEEQRSLLTKFIKANPNGGIIVLEEADFAHEDVFKLITNMITEKKFTDGLGQVWDTSRFIIYMTTNVGQELFTAKQSIDHQITWEEMEMRLSAILEDTVIDGKTIKQVKPKTVAQAFEQFLLKIVKSSNPNADTADALANVDKLKRRIEPDVVLPPEQQDILKAGRIAVAKYILNAEKEFGVKFTISIESIDQIIDIKNFRMAEGHGFVDKQLQSRLFRHLSSYLSQRGKKFDISLGAESVQLGKKSITGMTLILNDAENKKQETYSLGVSVPNNDNPWFKNQAMMDKITKFPELMGTKIFGQEKQIETLHRLLKEKALNWNKRIVFTQLGTSGNGKTEFGYSLAETLFGDRSAAFKISGISAPADLNNYFRSNAGYVGSNEETEFEKWFKSRQSIGGGVIIIDEILSLSGLQGQDLSNKIAAFNRLYDMLDEGVIRIGNKSYDAKGFIIEVTGNALQELFAGVDDSPGAERLIERILEGISKKDIEGNLKALGFDAPKIARLGPIFVNGPLKKKQTQQVGMKDLQRQLRETTRELNQFYNIDVQIDQAIVDAITARVSTVTLGMREVNGAISAVIQGSVSAILFDLLGTERINAKLINGQIHWYADDVEVVRVVRGSANGVVTHTWITKSRALQSDQISTPQLKDIEEQPKVILTSEKRKKTATHEHYGHWMTTYLLTGKNSSEAINIKPGDGYLGFVRAKDKDKEYEGNSLNSWLKEMAILEAGHRAVFIYGFYAGGGGSSGKRDGEKYPSDDLGKVNNILESIMSNNLFNEFTEFDTALEKDLFKKFMRPVVKGMADRIVRYGMNSKQFDPLFEILLKDSFLSGAQIEDVVSKTVDQNKIASPDRLFVWSLSQSVITTLQSLESRKTFNARQISQLKRLGLELVSKAVIEVKSTNKLRGIENSAELENTLRDARSKILGSSQQVTERFVTPVMRSEAIANGPAANSCRALYH